MKTKNWGVWGKGLSYLIKRWENVVGELYFRNRGCPHVCETYTETCDSLLAKRSIEDSVLSETIRKTHRASEDSAEGYVLAEKD